MLIYHYEKFMPVKKFYFFIIAGFALSCSSNKYAATNKVYKHQAKAFGKIISQSPVKRYLQHIINLGRNY